MSYHGREKDEARAIMRQLRSGGVGTGTVALEAAVNAGLFAESSNRSIIGSISEPHSPNFALTDTSGPALGASRFDITLGSPSFAADGTTIRVDPRDASIRSVWDSPNMGVAASLSVDMSRPSGRRFAYSYSLLLHYVMCVT